MSTHAVELKQSSTAALFSNAEVEQYARDGYVIARGLAGEPMWRQMLAVTLDDLNRHAEPIEFEADLRYPGAPGSRDDVGGRTVRRLKQAHSRHAVFTEWLILPALVGRVRQLLGPEVVVPLAHHNCIMTKQPEFSSETGWHQDIRYWSFERPELVSVWLALGPEREENGCLKVVPGSHRPAFEKQRFDEAMFFRKDLAENQPVLERAVFAPLEPGDVLFFHCRTFHAASRNYTNKPKYSVVFTYRAADNHPLPGTRSTSLPELRIP